MPEMDMIIEAPEKDLQKDMAKEKDLQIDKEPQSQEINAEKQPEIKRAPMRKEKTIDELITNAKIKCELDKMEKEFRELIANHDKDMEQISPIAKTKESELKLELEPQQELTFIFNDQQIEKEKLVEKIHDRDDKEELYKSIKETRKKIQEMNRAYMKSRMRTIIKTLANKKNRGQGKVPEDKVNAVDERQDKLEQEYQNIDNDVDFTR